jgi:RND family efflux transporter MFP subunit
MQSLVRLHARLVASYGQKKVIVGAGLLGVLVAFFIGQFFIGAVVPEEAATSLPVVTVLTVGELMDTSLSVPTLGTVSAMSEARLVTETGGRVTSVRYKLGDRVGAGSIIATLENSRERAVLLQAEGSYDAARASALTSDVGSASAERAYDEALTQATNAYRSAYTTANDVLRNTVDQVFSNPDTAMTGVRIDSNGRSLELIATRRALETTMDTWGTKIQSDFGTNGSSLLSEADSATRQLSNLVTTITALLTDNDAVPNEIELAALRSDFATAQRELNGTLQTLSGARTALIGAETAKTQAQISGSRGEVSLSDAHIKQALGALHLAQANLEKTIIRSPISGTLDALTIKEGTTVAPGTPAALISGIGALEIVAYIHESDTAQVKVGTPVLIEGGAKGVVTQMASALDPATKKIEIRIGITESTTDLTSGETVRITLTSENTDSSNPSILLPIVSIKMTPNGPIVFSVRDDNTLIPHDVTLGAIIGDRIVIEEGVTTDLAIVTDARGLRAGERITVK